MRAKSVMADGVARITGSRPAPGLDLTGGDGAVLPESPEVADRLGPLGRLTTCGDDAAGRGAGFDAACLDDAAARGGWTRVGGGATALREAFGDPLGIATRGVGARCGTAGVWEWTMPRLAFGEREPADFPLFRESVCPAKAAMVGSRKAKPHQSVKP